MKWHGDGAGIMDYPTEETTASGALVTKIILEWDGELELVDLKVWVKLYVSSKSRASQDDDIMLFNCIVNSITSDGLVKIYSKYNDFTTAWYNNWILLLKVVLEESGQKVNAKNWQIRTNYQICQSRWPS